MLLKIFIIFSFLLITSCSILIPNEIEPEIAIGRQTQQGQPSGTSQYYSMHFHYIIKGEK